MSPHPFLDIIAYTFLAIIAICGVISLVLLIQWAWNDQDKDSY